jgi:23S rRNA (cytidine1920-2'-O)/16S rRNA (cytidine1409-2'-O)-methyltransferase
MTPQMIGGPAALTVADLSFISLTLVVAPLAACTEPGGDLVLMVKPQFEIGKDRLGRTGVVTSVRERRMAVAKVASAAMDAGLDLAGLAQSPLPGQDGNVEYFLWIKRGIRTDLPKIEERDAAVAALLGTIWPEQHEKH